MAPGPLLLIRDLPPSSLAGIDLLAFTPSSRFRGVRGLPSAQQQDGHPPHPGGVFHFVYAAATQAGSERSGVWIRLGSSSSRSRTSEGEVVVLRWDPELELLVPCAEDEGAAAAAAAAALGDDGSGGLVDYAALSARGREERREVRHHDYEDEDGDWRALTSDISAELLSRVLLGTGEEAGHDCSWTMTSASSSPRDLEVIPGLDEEPTPPPPSYPYSSSSSSSFHPLESEGQQHNATPRSRDPALSFLPIDLVQTWPSGATGRERTLAARDRSWALGALASPSPSQIIGELQLCFVAVVTLGNFSALEQWRRLLTLLLTCRAAVAEQPGFFAQALATLRAQVERCGASVEQQRGGLLDFSADEATAGWMRGLLVGFRKGVEGLKTSPSPSSSSSSSSSAAAAVAAGWEMEVGVDVGEVLDELDDLEALLSLEYGWEFGGVFVKSGVLELEDGERVRMDTTAFDEDDETGEFAPVVVDLTPEQARMLGMEDVEALHETMGRSRIGEAKSENGSKGLEMADGNDGYHDRSAESSEEGDSGVEEEGELEDMDVRF